MIDFAKYIQQPCQALGPRLDATACREPVKMEAEQPQHNQAKNKQRCSKAQIGIARNQAVRPSIVVAATRNAKRNRD